MRSSRSGGARTFDVERPDGRAAGMHDAASPNTVRRSVLAVGGSYGSLPQVVGLSPDWVHEERHVGHFCNFGSSHAGGARGPVLTDASVAQPTARRADGALRKTEIMFYCAHPASLGRGVARDRHDTRGGDAMAAMEPQRVVERCADERRCCGRKSVWSWRPEAGAQSGGDDPADVGGYQAGRARHKRKTPSRREGRSSRLHPWYLPPAFFCPQAGHGPVCRV